MINRLQNRHVAQLVEHDASNNNKVNGSIAREYENVRADKMYTPNASKVVSDKNAQILCKCDTYVPLQQSLTGMAMTECLRFSLE